MAQQIQTIEYHQAQIDEHQDAQLRRLEQQLDVSDCALSSWASDSQISFHRLAIRCLQLGQKHGDNEPWSSFLTLLDDLGNTVDARRIPTQFGSAWLLGPKAEAKYGRRFIPTGRRSRIQKQLGLHEEMVEGRCSRWIEATCGGIGMPVGYITKPTNLEI